MIRSVPSTSYLLPRLETSGLFLMFCPLARQVTVGKGRPETAQATLCCGSFSFTIWFTAVSPKLIGWTITRSKLRELAGLACSLQMYSPSSPSATDLKTRSRPSPCPASLCTRSWAWLEMGRRAPAAVLWSHSREWEDWPRQETNQELSSPACLITFLSAGWSSRVCLSPSTSSTSTPGNYSRCQQYRNTVTGSRTATKTRIYTYPHPPSFFTFYLPALQYCQNGSDQQMKVFAIYFPSFVFGKLCEINHKGSCNTLSILKFSDETQTVRRLKMLAQQKFDICIRGTSNKNSHGVESYQMSSPKLVQDR